jgi:hypothetical protein
LRDPDLVGTWLLPDHLRLEVKVGARRHRDRVVLAGDLDDRHAGRGSLDLAHAGAVDVAVGQKAAQAVGEGIVADRADHRRRNAEARGRDRLVEPLAAGQERHGGAQKGLAGRGPPRALHDDVHVKAAADDDATHVTNALVENFASRQASVASTS